MPTRTLKKLERKTSLTLITQNETEQHPKQHIQILPLKYLELSECRFFFLNKYFTNCMNIYRINLNRYIYTERLAIESSEKGFPLLVSLLKSLFLRFPLFNIYSLLFNTFVKLHIKMVLQSSVPKSRTPRMPRKCSSCGFYRAWHNEWSQIKQLKVGQAQKALMVMLPFCFKTIHCNDNIYLLIIINLLIHKHWWNVSSFLNPD